MNDVDYRGIKISSRYDNASEISAIRCAIDLLSSPNCGIIKSIWCDSKASAVYMVDVEVDWPIDDLMIEIDIAFRAGGGHNGIFLTQGERDEFVAPWWPEDEFDPVH